MPLNVKVTVELSRNLLEVGRRAPQVMLQTLRQTMQAAVLVTETKVKQFITEIGLVDNGLLRSRIHGRVLSVTINNAEGEAATANVKYARIHEYGGTIRPKNGSALAIPFNEESARIQQMAGSLRNLTGLYVVKREGHAFLYKSGSPKIGWTLMKSVYIREKAYMRTGLERSRPDILRLFENAAKRAIAAVFGKGGVTAE